MNERAINLANLTRLLHAPAMNFVSDSVFVAGFDSALMPCNGLVDPVVMTCWISLRILTTG